MNMFRTTYVDMGLCELFVEVNSPVELWAIDRSIDGFDIHAGRVNLQISLTQQSMLMVKTLALLAVVHLVFGLVFGAHSLLAVNLTELGVWALLTRFALGVSAKVLVIWLILFFAVDGLFTAYGYGPWLTAEPPELLLWVLIAKRFTA
jgi:hypothetical protein